MTTSKQLFTASDYHKLHSLVFHPNYPGYKPDVVEAPNGDGKKDELKRYAHVSEKHLFVKNDFTLQHEKRTGFHPNHEGDTLLTEYLEKAHQLSLEVAIAIGVPRPFWPVRKHGALRVLEYDGQATSVLHTDFSLFTLMCYRNDESWFLYGKPQSSNHLATAVSSEHLERAKKLNAQVHFGELLEEILPDDFVATPHEVAATGGPWQYSCVYFAVPDEEAVLPSGQTVGKWMIERKNRSRYER